MVMSTLGGVSSDSTAWALCSKRSMAFITLESHDRSLLSIVPVQPSLSLYGSTSCSMPPVLSLLKALHSPEWYLSMLQQDISMCSSPLVLAEVVTDFIARLLAQLARVQVAMRWVTASSLLFSSSPELLPWLETTLMSMYGYDVKRCGRDPLDEDQC